MYESDSFIEHRILAPDGAIADWRRRRSRSPLPALLAMAAAVLFTPGCDRSAEVEPGDLEDLISDVTADIHDDIGSVVVVTWNQLEAKHGWVEYTFDEDDWRRSPPRDWTEGSQRELLLGIPYGTDVVVRLVGVLDAVPTASDEVSITTDALPAEVPTASVVTSQPGLWDPDHPYLLAGLEDWTVILDRQGRVVWVMKTPAQRVTMHPQTSLDGTDILIDHGSFWATFDNGKASEVIRVKIDGTVVETYATEGLHHPFAELGDGSLIWSAIVGYGETIQRLRPDGGQEQIASCADLLGGFGEPGYCGSNTLRWHEPDDSLLYLVVMHLEEPTMPPKQDKLEDQQLDMLKRWIVGGLLQNSGSKAKQVKKPAFDMALSQAPSGRPEGPPPVPQDLLLEPLVVTERGAALGAIAASPWAPVVALSGQKQVLLYNTDSLDLAGVLPFPEGAVQALSFSRNGRLVLAGGGRGGASGRVVVWNVEDGRRVIEVGQQLDAALAADISADQTQIAMGGPGRLLDVYDTSDGQLLRSLKKHTEWVTAIAYSPDGVLLASGDRNGGLQVWESYTGGEYYTLGGHGGAITGLSWRTDSNMLASASEDGTIRLWEMFEGRQVKRWNAHGGGVLSVHFHHDGQLVSSGRDRQIKLWDADGKELRAFEAFGDLALQAALSHDAKRVVGGDWAGQVRVWNASDGTHVGEPGVRRTRAGEIRGGYGTGEPRPDSHRAHRGAQGRGNETSRCGPPDGGRS